MKSHDSVAKPAEPRPIGGGDRGALRDCDPVNIAAGAVRYLLDLAKCAMWEVDDAHAHMANVSVEDPSMTDEIVEARAAALAAISYVTTIRDALDVLIPEGES